MANDLGLAHLDAGQLPEAEAAFKRAIAADKNFGPAYNHLGKVYYLNRLYYQAAHQFDRAAELMPTHAAPHNNLGLTLAKAGKLDDAVLSFRQAVSLAPLSIDYQCNLARVLVQRGDQTEEVIVLLQAIVAKDERLPWRLWANQELAAMGLEPQ